MFTQNLSSITPAQIEAVAPKSKSCSDADLPDECATSKQAAPAIARSFAIYKVASRAEQAAVIGLMAFESAEFQYSRNQYHGVPGQGTRNMQSPAFNLEYAQSIPALKDQVASIRGDPVQMLDLLLTKAEYDFGSGAWFLTSQCDREVRTALQSGSEEGWARFISSCVGTDANKERRAYWRAAVEALQ